MNATETVEEEFDVYALNVYKKLCEKCMKDVAKSWWSTDFVKDLLNFIMLQQKKANMDKVQNTEVIIQEVKDSKSKFVHETEARKLELANLKEKEEKEKDATKIYRDHIINALTTATNVLNSLSSRSNEIILLQNKYAELEDRIKYLESFKNNNENSNNNNKKRKISDNNI